MSRSGYVDGIEDPLELGRWRAQVLSAIRGRRGQSFLRELATAMDAMPVKELIAEELIDSEGQCCTLGVVCAARGIDVSQIDPDEPDQVAQRLGIAEQMVREIVYKNDEEWGEPTPAHRWERMRKWVATHLREVS